MLLQVLWMMIIIER